MNNALLKKLGIKESQLVSSKVAVRGKKETTDSAQVKEVRQKMNMTYLSHTKLVSASYLDSNFARDENGKILRDKDGKNIIESYTPKNINGEFLLDDNKDGTHTATKLNVYKETYLIDSESIRETKRTS